jgi:hypothetical protein
VLYLIGGPPRTGKSALALAFLRQERVPWLSTDVVRTLLRRVVPSIEEADAGFDRTEELIRLMRPFIDQIIEVCLGQASDYLIEGVEILPSDVARFRELFGPTSCCFLGDSRASAAGLRDYRGENPWHVAFTDEELERMATGIRRWSERTAEGCTRAGVDYVDMGVEGFERGIARGLELLLRAS